MNMKVNFAGVEMLNPVTTASGTFGSGIEYSDFGTHMVALTPAPKINQIIMDVPNKTKYDPALSKISS